METDDGTDLVLSIHVEGIRKELAEALLILNYEGESAELYQDGSWWLTAFIPVSPGKSG